VPRTAGPPICKRTLADELARSLSTSHRFARRAIDAFQAILTDHLLAGDSVQLAGFGRFHLKRTGRRPCNLPNLNATIGGHRVPAFRPSDSLKRIIRQRPGEAPPQPTIPGAPAFAPNGELRRGRPASLECGTRSAECGIDGKGGQG